MGDGVRCMLMRGGTSKGAYFLAEDLPQDPAERDDLLLRIMGSPDPRQIDGIGGAHPLTSKVAVISPSARADADVDYLFLQVGVDQAMVSDRQNCGNLLAGVGPFAVERGLVSSAPVRIHMVNSGSVATASFPGADGVVDYDGDVAIAGVPGTAAAVVLDFTDTEGSATGALLPTGHVADVSEVPPQGDDPPGTPRCITVTCIDNGMPVVVVPAAELGRTGYETVAELEADPDLGRRVQALRLAAGQLMGLGDVSAASVPKISLIAAPADGGTICTRTFIPIRVHESIGVLGAVSVATALLLNGAAGADLAAVKPGQTRFDIEHPTGHLEVEAEVDTTTEPPTVIRSGVVRTARKLFDGTVFPRRSR
jgi:4-oxalomesaconate tautomerase